MFWYQSRQVQYFLHFLLFHLAYRNSVFMLVKWTALFARVEIKTHCRLFLSRILSCSSLRTQLWHFAPWKCFLKIAFILLKSPSLRCTMTTRNCLLRKSKWRKFFLPYWLHFWSAGHRHLQSRFWTRFKETTVFNDTFTFSCLTLG